MLWFSGGIAAAPEGAPRLHVERPRTPCALATGRSGVDTRVGRQRPGLRDGKYSNVTDRRDKSCYPPRRPGTDKSPLSRDTVGWGILTCSNFAEGPVVAVLPAAERAQPACSATNRWQAARS
jgi:hypothetical protein